MHTPTIELSAKHDRRSSGEEPGYFMSGSQDATQLQRAGKKAVLKVCKIRNVRNGIYKI